MKPQSLCERGTPISSARLSRESSRKPMIQRVNPMRSPTAKRTGMKSQPDRQKMTKSIRQHHTSTSHKDVKHGHHCSPERNSSCTSSFFTSITSNRQRFCRHGLEVTRVRWDGSRLITLEPRKTFSEVPVRVQGWIACHVFHKHWWQRCKWPR